MGVMMRRLNLAIPKEVVDEFELVANALGAKTLTQLITACMLFMIKILMPKRYDTLRKTKVAEPTYPFLIVEKIEVILKVRKGKN